MLDPKSNCRLDFKKCHMQYLLLMKKPSQLFVHFLIVHHITHLRMLTHVPPFTWPMYHKSHRISILREMIKIKNKNKKIGQFKKRKEKILEVARHPISRLSHPMAWCRAVNEPSLNEQCICKFGSLKFITSLNS